MDEFSFDLIIGIDDFVVDGDSLAKLADELFEAGCDDATLSSCGDIMLLSFDREAPTYDMAVTSAKLDVLSVKQISSINLALPLGSI